MTDSDGINFVLSFENRFGTTNNNNEKLKIINTPMFRNALFNFALHTKTFQTAQSVITRTILALETLA